MEVAAGAVAAEQAISTTVEGSAAAAAAIAYPTAPLKATFTKFGSTSGSGSPDSLARSSHTLNVIDGDIYIFGGLVGPNTLASNEIHILKLPEVNAGGAGSIYKMIPALAADKNDPGSVPKPRAGHSACVINDQILVWGGLGDAKQKTPVEEVMIVWAFDHKTVSWTKIEVPGAAPSPRSGHSAAVHGTRFLIYGGTNGKGKRLSDLWAFDASTRNWQNLPPPSDKDGSATSAHPANLAVAHDMLYLYSSDSHLTSRIHSLDLAAYEKEAESTSWQATDIPTNPLTPGPQPRTGAGTLFISTGLGRDYVLLLFGEADHDSLSDSPGSSAPPEKIEPESTTAASMETLSLQDTQQSNKEKQRSSADATNRNFFSCLWTLQLPSKRASPAQAKDVVRHETGHVSGVGQWWEVQLVVKEERAETWANRGAAAFAGVGEAASGAARSIGESATGFLKKLQSANASQPESQSSNPPCKESKVENPSPELKPAATDPKAAEQGHPALSEAKSHPGPRAYFSTACLESNKVILWGGVNPKGEREGDGWLIHLRI